jgi:pimeloyl-ACP methyl ester carboxylesterase
MRSITPSRQWQDETGFLETGGERVRYRVRGDGPPLLMIHGIGAPLEFWARLEVELADFRTITVDPPGAGRSSTPHGRFTMRQFAGVMDGVLGHLELDQVNVLGLSLGGMIAQELAYRSPRRVGKLVLASTTCGLGSVPANPKVLAAIANPLRFYSNRHYRHIAPMLYGPQITKDSSALDEYIETRRECRPSLLGHFVQLTAACTWTSRPWLRKLDMPVMVIAGSEDQVVPVANGRMLASAVTDGRLEIIEGGSHMCPIQEPVRVSRMIRDFLEDV